MAPRFRLYLLSLVAFISAAVGVGTAATIEGVQEVDLHLNGLVYDPFTQRLYGSATNDLLQIDPESGQVLDVFPLGSNVTTLSLGAENGLWAAISGEHALRRFNLRTFEAADKIEYFPIAPTFDIAASKIDPQTVVFTTADIPQLFGATFVIRDGVVLPDLYQRGDFVQLEGNTLYLAKVGELLRMSIGPTGVIIGGFKANLYAQQFQVLGNAVYSSSGQVFNAETLELIDTLQLAPPGIPVTVDAVGKNETESSVYFFYDYGTGVGKLRRYEHPSRKLTGFVELPGITPDAVGLNPQTLTRLVSWGTNRVGFFAKSKLYLLDSSKVFARSDLEVTQSAPATAAFGASVNFDVSIHNKGRGAAIGVVFTNRASSGLVSVTSAKLGLAPAAPAAVKVDVIPPGETLVFRVSVLPTDVGIVTNQVDVECENEANTADNRSVATTFITNSKSVVTTLSFTPKALAYNAAKGRFYFLEDVTHWKTYTPYDAFGGTLVWSLDPETLHLTGGAQTAFGFVGTEILDASPGDGVYAAASGAFVSIDPDSLLVAPAAVGFGRVLYDMALSPADTNLIFISDENGSRLYKNGVPLPNGLDYHARAEFSEDGKILYVVNQETCSLNTYNVATDGLALLQKFGNISCSDFKASNGLLYLNSGTIVDASTGTKLTNNLSLSAPSFVLPRTNNVLDIVTRQNGIWSVRRLHSRTLQEIRRITLDQIDGSPTQIAAAGPNRLAIRTSGPGLYLVDLDLNRLGGRVVAGSNNSATIIFDTVPGDRYQVERRVAVAQGTWTPLGDSFVATDVTHSENISLGESKAAFFRVRPLAVN